MVTSVRSQLLLTPAPGGAVMPVPRLLSIGFGGVADSAPPIRPQCAPRSPRRYQPLLASMSEERVCGRGGRGYFGILGGRGGGGGRAQRRTGNRKRPQVPLATHDPNSSLRLLRQTRRLPFIHHAAQKLRRG